MEFVLADEIGGMPLSHTVVNHGDDVHHFYRWRIRNGVKTRATYSGDMYPPDMVLHMVQVGLLVPAP